MPTSINFDKKLGFINGTSIVLPSGPAGDFSTKSLSFDGVDEYVKVADADSLSFGNGTTDLPFSISAWVNMTDATRFRIVSKYDSNLEYLFSTGGSDTIVFNCYDNSTVGKIGRLYSTSLTSFQGTWIHLAATYSGNGSSTGLKIYLNGSRVDDTNNNSGSYTAMENTTTPLEIGKLTTTYANGLIDEVAIFNSELSVSDITAIYNNGKPADLTSLNSLVWYRAGENSTFSYPQILMPEDTNKDKVSKYSLSFDGVGDYIDLGNPTELQITALLTISLWVKMSSTTGQSQDCLISKDNGSSNRSYTLWGKTSFSSSPIAYVWNGGTNYSVQATTNIEDDQWHHVMLVYVPSTSLNIYIDGVLEGSNTTSIPVSINNANQNINIGRFGNATFQTASNIDEVAIWSDDLSASANAIYNGGIPTDIASLYPTRLEGYWKLGEEAKFTNNWLVPNSALSNFSKYSFNFDGVDDYVNCGNNATLSPTTELSISAWFKSSATSYQIIASKTYYRVDLINGSGRLVFIVYYSPSNFTSVYTPIGTSYQDGQWHHVLCTHQVNGRHKIYVDGVLLGDVPSSTSNIFTGSTPFIIGNKNTSQSFRFNGNIDEVAFWDSELSAGAVTAIYNGGKPKDLSGNSPISWWRMGEEATYDGTSNQFTIPDQGSGGNTGTGNNLMTLDTLVGDAPQYYGGGISDSMDIFDRVGDAPKSKNNTVSYNMEEADIVEDTP